LSYCAKEIQLKFQTPVVRQWTWLTALPQLIVLGVLAALCAFFLWDRYRVSSLSIAGAIFLAYSYGSRALLLKYHREGIALTHQTRYEEAIDAFKKSYDFFSRHLWVDRFRSLTMMTPASQSFREMALINIAYSYGQLGDKDQTKLYYERALKEFPDSSIAQVALNFIQTMETNTTS
jgi:tetratricopeptide (TPR) repeat protein